MLRGKTALITGANQGLGLEIAEHFVRNGASVMICGRSQNQLAEAVQILSAQAEAGIRVCGELTDVSDPQQVKRLVKSALTLLGQIDILVACAGVYGPKGPVEETDWADWSQAIDINLKGSVLPAISVLPYMKQRKQGKIIFISGGGATKPLPGLSAYAASKAGVVRFAETLAEETRPFGIDVNSVAPGALNTRLLDEVLAAGPEKVGEKFYKQSLRQKEQGGTPLSVGAELCVFLASSCSNGITGRLISAVWDPWKKMTDYLDEICQSDIYTLRRIVPKDRGMTWGDV